MEKADALRLLGALAIACGLPLLLLTLLRRAAPRRREVLSPEAFEGGAAPLADARRRIAVRWLNALPVALVLVAFFMLLLPVAAAAVDLPGGIRWRLVLWPLPALGALLWHARRRGALRWR